MMYLLLAVVPHAGRQNVSADHRLEKDGGGHGHARHRKPDRPYAPVPGLWAEPYDHGRWDPAVPVSPTYVQCTRGRRDGRRLVQPSCFPVSPRIKASGFLGLMASVGIGDPSASSSSFERAAARIMPGAGDSRPMCIGLLCMLRNFVRCSQERRQERCCIS